MSGDRLTEAQIIEIVTARLVEQSESFLQQVLGSQWHLFWPQHRLADLGLLAANPDLLELLLTFWQEGNWSENPGMLMARLTDQRCMQLFGTIGMPDDAIQSLANLWRL